MTFDILLFAFCSTPNRRVWIRRMETSMYSFVLHMYHNNNQGKHRRLWISNGSVLAAFLYCLALPAYLGGNGKLGAFIACERVWFSRRANNERWGGRMGRAVDGGKGDVEGVI
jgi:hypothetical protein